MKLSPDFEKAFLEYQEQIDRGLRPRMVLANTILGDTSYTNQVRMPGYNGDVDMLHEPRVAIKHANNWGIPTSKHAHRLRADHFEEIASAIENEHINFLDAARRRFGNGDGVWISGEFLSHFPNGVKNRLRFLSHGLPMVQDAVRLHRYLSKTKSAQFHN
jgi:hypothetical protein